MLFFRYTHIEAEFGFIDYAEFLDRVEDLIVDVTERILASSHGDIVYELNPDFKPPKKPFRRMDYKDAITYLKEHNITKDDGTFYEFGEDIPEMPERKMTDEINEPIMLCRFPANIKSFYMAKTPEDGNLTESVSFFDSYMGHKLPKTLCCQKSNGQYLLATISTQYGLLIGIVYNIRKKW